MDNIRFAYPFVNILRPFHPYRVEAQQACDPPPLQAEARTLGRHFWMSVHNMTSVLFCIFLGLHVAYNWRPLLRYLKSVQPLRFSREGVAAVAMVVVIVGVFASHVFHVR